MQAMPKQYLTQEELDMLFAGYDYGRMQRHAAKVSGSVLPSGIPLIRIDGRTLGTEESAHIIKIVCDMAQDIDQRVNIDRSACRHLFSFALGSLRPLPRRAPGTD